MGRKLGAPVRRYEWRTAVVQERSPARGIVTDLLAAQPGLGTVWIGAHLGDFSSWLAGLAAPRRPHVVVFTPYVGPGHLGDLAVVREIAGSGIRVVACVTERSPVSVRALFRAGVTGIVDMQEPERHVAAAVWTVLGGRIWPGGVSSPLLTEVPERARLRAEEERALMLHASGVRIEELAEVLGVRPDTARRYLSRTTPEWVAFGQQSRWEAPPTARRPAE